MRSRIKELFQKTERGKQENKPAETEATLSTYKAKKEKTKKITREQKGLQRQKCPLQG